MQTAPKRNRCTLEPVPVGDPSSEHLVVMVADRLSVINRRLVHDLEEAAVTDQSAERHPIGWWLKTADSRIEQAFERAFENQSITRREWQVLEPVSHTPMPESELLNTLEAFAGAQVAVDDLRARGLLADNGDGVLELTGTGHVAHGLAAVRVAAVRRAVGAALPGENYATLTRLLADLVEGLDRDSTSPR